MGLCMTLYVPTLLSRQYGSSDMLSIIQKIVRDTFRLDKTPHESHILGLMGTLPYFATSLSSVFLTWNLTKTLPTAHAFENMVLFDHDTARHLLSIIEPLQLGYGAVIISFLGAVHWVNQYSSHAFLLYNYVVLLILETN